MRPTPAATLNPALDDATVVQILIETPGGGGYGAPLSRTAAGFTFFASHDCSSRGRGIARGVKLQTLAQAAELGVPEVRTDNDSENAPMLHINERSGYHPRPGFVEHHKRVTKKHDA